MNAAAPRPSAPGAASYAKRAAPVDPDLMAELQGDDDDDDGEGDETIIPLGYRDAHTPQLEEPVPVYEHVYRPGSAARGERAVERPPDVVRVPTSAAAAAAAAGAGAKVTVGAAGSDHASEPPVAVVRGTTAKETLQLAMAAREKHDAELRGAVAAAQEDMLAEVGALRRSTSLAGRFRADVEGLISKAGFRTKNRGVRLHQTHSSALCDECLANCLG